MRRRLKYTIRTLLGLTFLVAGIATFFSESNYEIRENLAYWPDDIIASLIGREISVCSNANGYPIEYTNNAVITQVKLNKNSLDEITIRLPLWKKLRIMCAEESELAWIDYGMMRGGAVRR